MPSPAIVVAVLALVAALAGTAVAEVATTARLDKKEKKQVKKIAKKQINKLAPGLSVAHADTADSATNADTVDGKHASELQTSSGFASRTGPDLTLTATPQNVISTDITTTGTRVIAVASVRLFGNGGTDDVAFCQIQIAGVDGPVYLHAIPDASVPHSTTALTFSRVLDPGTHAAALRCQVSSGAVGVENADLSVWSVGS
jgi:hypothetical protein